MVPPSLLMPCGYGGRACPNVAMIGGGECDFNAPVEEEKGESCGFRIGRMFDNLFDEMKDKCKELDEEDKKVITKAINDMHKIEKNLWKIYRHIERFQKILRLTGDYKLCCDSTNSETVPLKSVISAEKMREFARANINKLTNSAAHYTEMFEKQQNELLGKIYAGLVSVTADKPSEYVSLSNKKPSGQVPLEFSP